MFLECFNLFIKKKLIIFDYKDVLVELEKVKDKFENKDIKFGFDFVIEYEKYLVEEIVYGLVVIINFFKLFKVFYMY